MSDVEVQKTFLLNIFSYIFSNSAQVEFYDKERARTSWDRGKSLLRSEKKNELSHLQTLRGSFSAVAKPIFANRYIHIHTTLIYSTKFRSSKNIIKILCNNVGNETCRFLQNLTFQPFYLKEDLQIFAESHSLAIFPQGRLADFCRISLFFFLQKF